MTVCWIGEKAVFAPDMQAEMTQPFDLCCFIYCIGILLTLLYQNTPTRPHPYCNFQTRISYDLGPGACAHKAKLPGPEILKGWRQLCM